MRVLKFLLGGFGLLGLFLGALALMLAMLVGFLLLLAGFVVLLWLFAFGLVAGLVLFTIFGAVSLIELPFAMRARRPIQTCQVGKRMLKGFDDGLFSRMDRGFNRVEDGMDRVEEGADKIFDLIERIDVWSGFSKTIGAGFDRMNRVCRGEYES